MSTDLVFAIAVSFLLLHEMDAVDKREWRLLFILRRLPPDGGFRWFIALHLPLYVGLLVLIAADESSIGRWIQVAVDAFLVVHLGLHERLSARGERVFANPFSRTIIWSAAALAFVHLAAVAPGLF